MDVQTPDNNTHSLHTIYIKTLLAVSRTKTEGCQTRIGIIENAGYARNGLAHKEQFAVKFVRMRGKKKKKTLREFIKAKAGNSEKIHFHNKHSKKFTSSSWHSLQTTKRL